jgi:two-component system, NarL family, nitrate/nitrite response regulator NarL
MRQDPGLEIFTLGAKMYSPPAPADSQRPLHVVLADDHDLIRAGIRAFLEKLPHVHVIGEARDGAELLQVLDRVRADVVITDVSMPNMDGLAAIRKIRQLHPTTQVLVLSVSDTAESMRQAVAAGANGYLMKGCAREELPRALANLRQMGSYFDSSIARKLLQPAPRGPRDELTERQIEVLVLIADGNSAKEIGYKLGLSPKTVDVHRSRIMERLQVSDIAGLTRYAVRMKLVAA